MGELIRKSYEGTIDDLNVAKREVVAVISTDAIDRDGEVVQPQGMKKKNFSGNPVVMLNHCYDALPIGKALWVKSDGNKIVAKYKVSDATQEARDVFGLLQDGTLSAHSIGFIPIRSTAPSTKEINARPDLKGAKLIHREFELLEFSVVGIPANPEALTMAVGKGYSAATLKFLGAGVNAPTAEPKPAETKVEDPKRLYHAEIIAAAKRLDPTKLEAAIERVLRRL